MRTMNLFVSAGLIAFSVMLAAPVSPAFAGKSKEFHVAVVGNDTNDGSTSLPVRTISAAARKAQPGDRITVHGGVYRERIDPPRGGTSDRQRIIYQAAQREKVVIKGSEVITGWRKLANDTWEVKIPNSFFGEFNPYSDLIAGDWFRPGERQFHTGAVYLDGHWLIEASSLEDVMQPIGVAAQNYHCDTSCGLWFAEVNEANTVIRAQLKGFDPDVAEVEVNVRQSVFYPSKPGVNFITVQGFTLEHAATPWAPPTAEQIGLIGTHWSKGWIIEANTIRYSVCTGITLGKHGDEFDNTSQDSARGYVETIERASKDFGWTKENIGNHVVRNNHISHCEQAGIVGSLGAVFSTITGNTIHDIHVRGLFGGAEMAGIKIHAPIDCVIADNHIYNTWLGIWMDWMTQGTRISSNLIHDNSRDMYVEVNHGPFLVDNNILLSPDSLQVDSCGGAYVHNLIAGKVTVSHDEKRKTPYLKPHFTKVLGLHENQSGDDRYYNNIFVDKGGLAEYDRAALTVSMAGNVFYHRARPSKHEEDPAILADVDPGLHLVEKQGSLFLEITLEGDLLSTQRPLVTTMLLG